MVSTIYKQVLRGQSNRDSFSGRANHIDSCPRYLIQKRINNMKLTNENIGKSYFDESVKGNLIAITFQNMNQGILTGNVDICSNAGKPERMYEVEGVGEVWEWCLVWILKEDK